MKIIHALKELPLIDKKITKNTQLLEKYSAAVANGEHVKLSFKSIEEQTQEVNSLLQSNKDLVQSRASLRRNLAITNATVFVAIDGQERTITEWIEYRQYGLKALMNTFSSLSDQRAVMEVVKTPANPQEGVKVIKFYDEKFKNEELSKIMELQNKIDTTLEVVNATTDLIEAPVAKQAK